MSTKLTLRIEEALVKKAKSQAKSRGKSVSRMIQEFIALMGNVQDDAKPLPPITQSLLGVLKGSRVSEKEYKRHLVEKYR